MSGDLISRSAVIELIEGCHILEDAYCLVDYINELPASYNAENVAKRLQTELNLADKEKERCSRENPLQFDEAKGYARGMAVALEIVKSGCIATGQKGERHETD